MKARATWCCLSAICEEQIAGFSDCRNQPSAAVHEAKDWRAFTRRYNGPGNVDVYSGRLVRALKVIESLEQDGAVFAL
ncbi:conserved hypothetical protein [delta proteobacterium NaphS2]|nr:conserved hypothetical protein [delta proteobacterium NaphS2]